MHCSPIIYYILAWIQLKRCHIFLQLSFGMGIRNCTGLIVNINSKVKSWQILTWVNNTWDSSVNCQSIYVFIQLNSRDEEHDARIFSCVLCIYHKELFVSLSASLFTDSRNIYGYGFHWNWSSTHYALIKIKLCSRGNFCMAS